MSRSPPGGGVTFASGLKSILRQDPDVVFVGEMRDPEVSAIAVKAALTGHLVMSTLHTNSAAESLNRLADMDVPSYLLASSLLMVIAQRLLRRICEYCEEDYTPNEDEIKEFRLTAEQLTESNFKKGKGCSHCMNKGYKGRLAVYEILNVTNGMRDLIRLNRSPAEVVNFAREEDGMLMLYDAGMRAVHEGRSTLDEVRRTCSDAL